MAKNDFEISKKTAALLSVSSNCALVIFKLAVGIATGSVAVLSEALHSCTDLLSAIMVFVAVRISAQPADKEHAFGHAKVENLSALAEAAIILMAALWIVAEALHKLRFPSPPEHPGIGAAVMLCSTLANILVSRMLFSVGQRENSPALIADAWHLRADIYTSASVMLALSVCAAGARFAPGLNMTWLDPLAALCVAVLIVKAAYHLTSAAYGDLLDSSLPDSETKEIDNILRTMRPGLISHKNLKTRKAGNVRFISLDAIVNGQLSVKTSHIIADEISRQIDRRFPGAHVTVHIEPCSEDCTTECRANCTGRNQNPPATA
jgi:cation diffusion facilitator family transporter